LTFQVIPRELAFFDLFEEMADNLHEAAVALQGMVTGLSDPQATAEAAARIKELEAKGDELTHRTIALLNTTFVVPLDRDDIYDLTSTLDDILDMIEAAADLLVLYRLTDPIPEFRLLADVLVRSSVVVAKSMRAIRAPVGMKHHWVEISRLEREGDRVFHRGVSRLFSGGFKAMEILKWKDLLEELEGASDRCEDLANAVESIALKYG